MSMPPISRTGDPETSKQVDRLYTLTKRQTRCREVLELVRDYPGRTYGELGRKMIERYPDRPLVATASTPHKRLSDLFKMTLVSKGPARKCTDSGNLCHPYYISALGEKELD